MRIFAPTNIATLEGYHAVATADAVTNALMRDVVGNKTDALDTDASETTKSLQAFVKGILDRLEVPAADTAANYWVRQVIGSKADAAREAQAATYSAIGYLKGIIQELAQRGTAEFADVGGTSDTLADVVNITDKGVLTGVAMVMEGADRGRLKITIDGVAIMNDRRFVFNSLQNSLAFNHRFNTSLRVEHRNEGNAVAYLTYVAYTTD